MNDIRELNENKIETLLEKYNDVLSDSRISLNEVTYGYDGDKADTSHTLAKFYLGKNNICADGNLSVYLRDVSLLVDILERAGFSTWLVEWKNDCLDDLSELTLGIRGK